MRRIGAGAGFLVAAVFVAVACGSGSGDSGVAQGGGGGSGGGASDSGTGTGGTGTGGTGTGGTGTGGGSGRSDGGSGGQSDAGVPPDGGTDGGTDGGSGGGIVSNAQGWTFYQAKDGLTSPAVMGASADEGGNLWVAGGNGGVFVQRAGGSTFQQYGLADGLHPYGYMRDGGPSDTNPYLEAISISGGPAGTAFVGYMGKTPAGGNVDACENNWDGPNPDPAIYKSGDADKVTLNGSGIKVVHYDIFTGPNVIAAEMQGREKLCHIYRVVYQHGTRYVWFGGNHGFAMGHADFPGNPTCDGQRDCEGIREHIHPAINGWSDDDSQIVFLTSYYRGVDVDPLTKDVWFGGLIRTTLFRFQTSGGEGEFFNKAETRTEAMNDWSNRFDVWPDRVGEPNYPHKADRNDDNVYGIAAMPDGTAWIGSGSYGLRRIDSFGTVAEDATAKLLDKHVTALARDPADNSVWIGYPGRYGLGVSQLMPDGSIRHYNSKTLGPVTDLAVSDVQVDTFSTPHRILVSFCTPDPTYQGLCSKSGGGVLGVYQPK